MKELNESILKAAKKELRRKVAILEEAQEILEGMPKRRIKRRKKKVAKK